MRITKVYTKTGDDGSTGLVGGTRVPKHDPRLETYGTVDELSSSLGLIRAELYRCAGDFSDEGDRTLLDRHIAHLQNELFDLGTELATEREARWPDMRRVDEASVAYLESLLDAYAETLPPLKDFVIPAGNAVVANFHLARCIARRAERRVAALGTDLDGHELRYLNRFSDLLFVLARWSAHAMGAQEIIWHQGAERPPLR